MSENFIDTIVIGAGVVGLAIARKFALSKRDVLVVEEQSTFGTITSTRNSGVIHAGVYYEKDSLKSKLCPVGNRLLYEYCERHKIPHINTGKFIVSSGKDESKKLQQIIDQSEDSEIEGIRFVSKEHVKNKESLIECTEALYVPSTGIIDQNALMRSYLGEIEDNSGSIAFNSKFLRSEIVNGCYVSKILSDSEEIEIKSNTLINAAGLYAQDISKVIESLDQKTIPKVYFAKGSYFDTGKNLNIKHLIYPVPNEASLGLHLGLDLGMQVRFGPDVEWINEINYDVNKDRLDIFYKGIQKYLPSIDQSILKPGYSGIRPKLKNKGEGKSDFLIQGPKEHNVNNLVNLYGIESPGLTSSLSIANYVYDLLH
tara:strand:+ start:2291 stop:3400 length:1110 start_codon:yes stop_codon:yes gene_type:complete